MSQTDKQLKTYYRKRSPVYDRVYAYPERQDDLRYLEQFIASKFNNKHVLEIAAGTGYWTQFIAENASSILATDITKEALEQIKDRPNCQKVKIQIIDAFSLQKLNQKFNAIFAGLWLSHVPKEKLNEFFTNLNNVATSGTMILLIDNSKTQCKRLPINHTDKFGNTYQDRQLDDGSTHRILKNFPNEAELNKATSQFGKKIKYLSLEHFWLYQYQVC